MAKRLPQKGENISLPNLRRLYELRIIVIVGWTIAILSAQFGLNIQLSIFSIFEVIALWTFLNYLFLKRIKKNEEISSVEFLGQLILDVGILTGLLFFTGGSTNPFTLLFLLPLSISAALLPARYTWILAALTVICYTALLFIFIPLTLEGNLNNHNMNHHVVGMWIGFVFSAGLIASFIVKMGNSLRERDHKLAKAKQRQLKDEQLIALGTLAASTAHELGTPLGTIAILTKEIEGDLSAENQDVKDSLKIISNQVSRCKSSLATLSASAGQSQANTGKRSNLKSYLEQTVANWQKMRPGINLISKISDTSIDHDVAVDQTLSQAIISILNNAADAAKKQVKFAAKWDTVDLIIEILDDGDGVTHAAEDSIGKEIFSTKTNEHGLGLGLFLAYSVIKRLKGEISLSNRKNGGTCAYIRIPIKQFFV